MTTTTAPAPITCQNGGHKSYTGTPPAKFVTANSRGEDMAVCGMHASAISRSWRARYQPVRPMTEADAQAFRFRAEFRRTVAAIESALQSIEHDKRRDAKNAATWAEYRAEAVTSDLILDHDWRDNVRKVSVAVYPVGSHADAWAAVRVDLEVNDDTPAVLTVRGSMWPKGALAVADAITYLSAIAEELNS